MFRCSFKYYIWNDSCAIYSKEDRSWDQQSDEQTALHSTHIRGMKLSEWNPKPVPRRSYNADVKSAFTLMARYLYLQTRCTNALNLPSMTGSIACDIHHSVAPGLVIGLSGYNSFSFEWFQKWERCFSEEGAPSFKPPCQKTSIFWATKWVSTCSQLSPTMWRGKVETQFRRKDQPCVMLHDITRDYSEDVTDTIK